MFQFDRLPLDGPGAAHGQRAIAQSHLEKSILKIPAGGDTGQRPILKIPFKGCLHIATSQVTAHRERQPQAPGEATLGIFRRQANGRRGAQRGMVQDL